MIDRLRLISARKTRIAMMLDNDLLVICSAKAEAEGIGCQTLINRTLRHAFGSACIGQRFLRAPDQLHDVRVQQPPDALHKSRREVHDH